MTKNTNHSQITIRRLGPADAEAIEALAQRDSKPTLTGAMIGAEVEGTLLAATELATGTTIADPFSRTAEVRGLLELRAAQLARREATERRGLRSRARATLASSPPGAGGRLLRLPPRLT